MWQPRFEQPENNGNNHQPFLGLENTEQIEAPFSAFAELEKIDRSKLRPQFDEFFGQLIASEKKGAYSIALADLESSDREVRDYAIEYLARHQAYLINAADTILRIGFNNPEEKAVSDEVTARLGVIGQKTESFMQ